MCLLTLWCETAANTPASIDDSRTVGLLQGRELKDTAGCKLSIPMLVIEIKLRRRARFIDTIKPAFLGRMVIVPYLPLGEETLNRIVGDKLDRLATQIGDRYHTDVELEDGLVEAIRSRATRSENGARMLESIIEGELLPPVSLALLEKLAAREPVTKVTLGVEDNKFTGTVA